MQCSHWMPILNTIPPCPCLRRLRRLSLDVGQSCLGTNRDPFFAVGEISHRFGRTQWSCCRACFEWDGSRFYFCNFVARDHDAMTKWTLEILTWSEYSRILSQSFVQMNSEPNFRKWKFFFLNRPDIFANAHIFVFDQDPITDSNLVPRARAWIALWRHTSLDSSTTWLWLGPTEHSSTFWFILFKKVIQFKTFDSLTRPEKKNGIIINVRL